MEFIFRLTYPLISKRPGFVIALILGVFILSFGAFSHVEVADEIEGGLSDPAALAAKKKFESNFAPEQNVSLAFEIDGIDRKSLLEIWDIVREIRKIPEVGRVMSILDLFRPHKNRESFQSYLKEFRIENAKNLLASDTVFRGFLISHDLRKACLVILPKTEFPDYQKGLYKGLQEIFPRLFAGKPYHVSGFIYFKERFFEFIARNNLTFLSLSALVCSVLTWFFFPDLVILLLILAAMGIPTVLTFAVYFSFGNKINIFTSPIIPFAFIISLNEIIYLISFFAHEKGIGKDAYDALHEKNFQKLLRPCFINTVTTLIGFFSLSQSPSKNIQLFSTYTSLACFLAYFISFSLVFAFLKLYQPPFAGRGRQSLRFQWLRIPLRNLTLRHPGKVLAVSLLLAILSLCSLGSFQYRNSLSENFDPGDPLVTSFDFFRTNFSGPYYLQIMLSHDQILTGRSLRLVEQFQERLKTLPEINRVFSIADLVRKFMETFSAQGDIPDSPVLLQSIVRFFADRGLSEFFVSPSWNIVMVRASIGISDDFQIAALRERILAIASETLPPDIQVELTGEVYLNAILQQSIITNISWSFALAFVMIAVVFFVAFFDLMLALIALAINFYPIFLAYVLASLAGIPINSSTMVVGCVMSGLVVDDTLHLLTVFREIRSRSKVRKLILLYREMIEPIMYSAVLLGMGNAIFVFSPFKPFTYFGGIGALIVFLGIICDLIVLPAMIMGLTKEERRP